jgi:hypothetical protein
MLYAGVIELSLQKMERREFFCILIRQEYLNILQMGGLIAVLKNFTLEPENCN